VDAALAAQFGNQALQFHRFTGAAQTTEQITVVVFFLLRANQVVQSDNRIVMFVVRKAIDVYFVQLFVVWRTHGQRPPEDGQQRLDIGSMKRIRHLETCWNG
jgi:hypothetical protein